VTEDELKAALAEVRRLWFRPTGGVRETALRGIILHPGDALADILQIITEKRKGNA